MTRELRLLKREIDMLERLHKRLDILLGQVMAASSVNINEAADIINYQHIITDKLARCLQQEQSSAGCPHTGFRAYLLKLDKLLTKLNVTRHYKKLV